MKAIIALEDGTVFEGEAFGAEGESYGEVIFNTSMSGYQEILTDPSYKGQIVMMTYPLIGNYGVNEEDAESWKPHVEGFVVKEYCRYYSNWRAVKSLGDYLKEHDIIGIEGIDTRALTRHIRVAGAMKAVISTIDEDSDRLAAKAKDSPDLVGRDLVKEVTSQNSYDWETSEKEEKFAPWLQRPHPRVWKSGAYRVAAIDYGVKRNILRLLQEVGCNVKVFPANTSACTPMKNPGGSNILTVIS